MQSRTFRAFAGIVIALLAGCATQQPGPSREDLAKIEHIVVIYAENRSFDNLYGLFPGANGIANAAPETYTQLDRDGKPLPHLPPVWKGDKPDPAFPANLPNRPFRLDVPPINLTLSVATRDLVHRFYQNQEQIAGGRNNLFAAVSDAGGLVMGYYDGSQLPMWKWAREYVLADNFFMGAFGGSYLNHFWLICACTPFDAAAPASARSQLDEESRLKRRPDSPQSALQGPPLFVLDGDATPDGYSVNTAQPPYQPSRIRPAAGGDTRLADPARHPLPPQTFKTIGDTLSAKGISWVWYAGAWSAALADGMQPSGKHAVIYNTGHGASNFVPHHQPFNYFARFAPGTPDRDRHLQDYSDFVAAIERGALPQVTFYKPQGSLNEHPGYTDVLSGDEHIAEVVAKIKASPLWAKTAIIVTYDENGGFWDHVAPPEGDRWGPGSRIPTIIISPWAKRAYIDSTPYDTTSILKFITRRFDLEPLPGVRPMMGDLGNAFDFSQR
ncbi:MAG: acid phosphatase [Burkholderiales bacterium]